VRDVDGEERTFSFVIEQEFVTDYYSILTQKPSEVTIIAVEDSTVICFEAAKFLALFDSSFNWQKIGRRFAAAGAQVFGLVFQGAWAEYVIAPGAQMAEIPAGITYAQAASLPVAGGAGYRSGGTTHTTACEWQNYFESKINCCFTLDYRRIK